MDSFSTLDAAIAAIMALGAARGLFVGMIREGFSIAAIGAAVLGARYGGAPVGAWLDKATAGEIGGGAGMWIGGIACAVFAGILVGTLGRYLRRGARIVGLGMADRIGGAAVGAAEGALVAAVVIVGATWAFGREHPAVYGSYSVAVFDEMRTAVETGELPDLPAVSSGPPPRRPPQQRQQQQQY